MKIYNFSKALTSLFLCIAALSLSGCNKKKEPQLTTEAVSLITQTTASVGGNVISDGGETILSRGVCWGIINTPTISGNKTIDSVGTANGGR